MPCITLFSVSRMRYGSGMASRGGLACSALCSPTQRGDGVAEFLLGEQSLPFQHLHEGRNVPHMRDGQFENGDGFFGVQLFSHAEKYSSDSVLNYLLIGCVHKPFGDLKIHFCERLTYSVSLAVFAIRLILNPLNTEPTQNSTMIATTSTTILLAPVAGYSLMYP